jgi:hypothetical protein
MNDELTTAIERVASTPADPATFPAVVSDEFREAAVELLDQVARLRFQADGGDLAELDDLDVDDPRIAVDLEDLRDLIAGFHADGDQRGYAACAAVFDWLVAQGTS